MKEKFLRVHNWFLRTTCCTVWLISLLFFIENGAVALASNETPQVVFHAERAVAFLFTFLVAILSHAFLVSEHAKDLLPK